jgi:hypothetical protein
MAPCGNRTFTGPLFTLADGTTSFWCVRLSPVAWMLQRCFLQCLPNYSHARLLCQVRTSCYFQTIVATQIGQLVTFSAFQHTASSGATGLQSIVIDPLGHCQKAAHFFPEYTIDGRTALAVLQVRSSIRVIRTSECLSLPLHFFAEL